MPKADCGFIPVPGGASGASLLAQHGPTLLVNIGFDPNFTVSTIPKAGSFKVHALVDSGAAESCIDSVLAAQLNLPIIDRKHIAGIGGKHEINIHLAQVYIPSLNYTLYGAFAGVHLEAGGQWHKALIGRTFLRHCTMLYNGKTGQVAISTD